jgi:LPS sulfotransferase NodH
MGASGPPKISYLICTTPRSGSTLLCELLTGTGVAGRPDEYFQQLRSTGKPMRPCDFLEGVAPDVVPAETHDGELQEHQLYDPQRFVSFEDYVDWVKDRATTPNGVFAAKIMWPYMAGLVDGLSTASGDRDTEDPAELLAETFPGLRYVWLRRMDKVRQAVSLWRALQTWNWRKDAAAAGRRAREQAAGPRLRYSFEAIDHLRRRLVSYDRAWEIYFEGKGIEPLTLTYEAFTNEVHETVTWILRHAGVRYPAGAHCGIPGTARQSDELSQRWVTEFRATFAGTVPAVR